MSHEKGHIGLAGVSRAAIVAGLMVALFAVLGLRGVLVATRPAVADTGIVQDGQQVVRRADIVDRNGELLATSVTVYSLFADPRAIWDVEDVVDRLMTVFPDLPRADLIERLQNRERRFEWVRRGLTPRQRQAVFDLGLEGLGFRAESHRAYPRGSQAGHLLGHTNVDGKGRMGVERAFEAQLVSGDAPVQLTLDSGVQFALEAELSSAAERHDVVGAAGIVIDALTGEVRALASWPAFDPNRPGTAREDEALNRVSGAVFELGSVFKPLTIAAALEAGSIAPDDTFDVRAPLVIAGKAITDTHRGTANMSVTDVLAESSNIGTVQIAQRLGGAGLQDFLRGIGLLDRAAIDFAVSASPILPERWADLEVATVSYGHGIAVTPLAFAQAFTAIANEGVIMPLRIVPSEAAITPRRVMSADTAETLRTMLRRSVTDGTGSRAEILGYEIAGKTGTAEKPVPGGYAVDRNITSFAALFPASSPQYVVLIVLDDPRPEAGQGATAAWNAAPTAGRVIERIAPLLGVMPVFDEGSRDARASEVRRAL